MEFPDGAVQTHRPGSQNRYAFDWEKTSKYAPYFELYGEEYGVDPRLLAAISVIESDSTQFRADGSVVKSADDGSGIPAIGMMQVKPQYWQSLAPAADAMTIAGNIELGAAILAEGIKTFGSWQNAIKKRYHPGTDPHSGATPETYVQTMQSLLDEIGGSAVTEPEPKPAQTMVKFAGATQSVPLDVPFRVVLIPTNQTRQRPGIRMHPEVYVQHETGNTGRGANAEMHLRYLQNGAEGQQLGYHFTVDEKEAIQMIPVNEVTWHGGDGGGQCNYTGVSCELCVQDGNVNKVQARLNAEKLAAAVMLATNVTRLIQHSDCCAAIGNPAGCHSRCPEYIRDDHYWPVFTTHVESNMAGISPAPIVVYASPQPAPPWDGNDVQVGKYLFRAAQRHYVAKTDGVKLRKWADVASSEVREPLKKGEPVTGLFLVESDDGDDWIVTNYGSRIRAAEMSPHISFAD